jgi:hypothetical protein
VGASYASFGMICSANRRIARSTSSRGSIEPWSNQQMICERSNSSRAAWSRSRTSAASPKTPWSRQHTRNAGRAPDAALAFHDRQAQTEPWVGIMPGKGA